MNILYKKKNAQELYTRRFPDSYSMLSYLLSVPNFEFTSAAAVLLSRRDDTRRTAFSPVAAFKMKLPPVPCRSSILPHTIATAALVVYIIKGTGPRRWNSGQRLRCDPRYRRYWRRCRSKARVFGQRVGCPWRCRRRQWWCREKALVVERRVGLDAPEDVKDVGGAPMPFEVRDWCLTYMCRNASKSLWGSSGWGGHTYT